MTLPSTPIYLSFISFPIIMVLFPVRSAQCVPILLMSVYDIIVLARPQSLMREEQGWTPDWDLEASEGDRGMGWREVY